MEIPDNIEQLFEAGIRGMYFRRDGTPYKTVMEWAADFEKGMKLRKVDDTILWWGGRVSTIWLGLNHSFSFKGPPLIFETMVFPPGSFQDLDMDRYSTEAQAKEGHKAMCKRWRFPFIKIARAWVWVILDFYECRLKR